MGNHSELAAAIAWARWGQVFIQDWEYNDAFLSFRHNAAINSKAFINALQNTFYPARR